MKRLEFNTTQDFVDSILEQWDDMDDDLFISVFGKFDIIKDIFESMIRNDLHIDIIVDLESDVSYCGEFALSMTKNGISVGKAWHDENEYHPAGYYRFDDETIAYIHEDCNSKLLSSIGTPLKYEFAIGSDEEFDNTICKMETDTVFTDGDGNPTGFSKTWNTTGNGISTYTSFTHFNENLEELKQKASEYNVDL